MTEKRGTPDQKNDAGWDVGVRETIGATVPAVWAFVIGDGLKFWLGDLDALPTTKKTRYETKDGVRGTIRSYTENSRVLMTWQPSDWPHDTTLQVSVKEGENGTVLAIRHEGLTDREERRMMLGHWKGVVASIAQRLSRY
jgi:uncharacterized protein YndB with AHSA1/START domain